MQAVAGLAVGQAVEIMAVRHRRALNQLVRCVPVEPAAAWSLMSIGPRNALEAERRRAAGRPRSGGHSFRASRTIRRKSSSSL